MNQAYFHTSYTPTQFANHSSRTIREPRPRNSNQRGESRNKVAGVPRGEFDEMMGYLCLCPPAVCRPSATYSCRPRSSDNLRILLSNSYRACSQENDKYDFDPQDDLIDQLHLDMGRIYRDLEKQPRFGFLPAMASLSAPSWPSLSAPSRWCTASPPQSQRGGVLDGGDSPHEPRLHGVHEQAREGL